MYGPTKTARWAIIGFVAVTILVLLGLTWATIASLQLEEATRIASALREPAHNIRLAMRRMDSEVMPALGRESSRWYHEYSAYYIPSTLRYEDNLEPAVTVWQESPLLDSELLEPWMVLHFQYTEHARWSSPQLPAPHKWPNLEVTPRFDPVREDLLARFDRSYGVTERFAQAIAEASKSDSAVTGRSIGPDHSGRVRRVDEYARRKSQVQKLLQDSRPPVLECEPAEKVLTIVSSQAGDPMPISQDLDYFPVHVSPFTPVWVTVQGIAEPQLALVRRAEVGPEVAYQGFLVDWKKLAESLTPLVAELFETVRLEPVLNPDEATEPISCMSTLPLQLVTTDKGIPSAGWTSTRTTVAFAWLAALVSLVALGLGVRSLVALTARRTEFTYAVTHELRTPLTTFQLYTDMLAAGLVPPEKEAAYLQTLNEESRRLSDLVTEVLEFSRIESNAVRTHPGAHSVGELLESIRERYASRCAAAGVDLTLDPNGSTDRRVRTDLHIALQILGTLIDNACKYASAPGRSATPETTPRVQISAHPGPHKLSIEVADNGPGIPSHDRHNLFKPFHRGSEVQGSKVGGVGLGLALAKRWSRLIHAHLELVDSVAARGACFRLTLPAE